MSASSRGLLIGMTTHFAVLISAFVLSSYGTWPRALIAMLCGLFVGVIVWKVTDKDDQQLDRSQE